MTILLRPHDIRHIVQQVGLPVVLGKLESCLREDFLRWEEFDKTARVATHSSVGVIELMPVADDSLYVFKYVNGHPGNPKLGLPTVMAFGALAEVLTGRPIVLSELTLTTALRTAATSVLAARVLARPDSRTMALIGNGSQSEFQALAFHYLLGINELRLYDVDPAASHKLVQNLASVSGLHTTVCNSTAEAVHGADIVTTVTADKTNAIILEKRMLEPGMHINAVGGDCPGKTELATDVLLSATTFVEFEAQSRIEGEIQHMPDDYPVKLLWQVLAGVQTGRQSDHEITVFDSVGFALEDYSALRLMQDYAQQHGLGQTIALMPDLQNPKNLYGELLGSVEKQAL